MRRGDLDRLWWLTSVEHRLQVFRVAEHLQEIDRERQLFSQNRTRLITVFGKKRSDRLGDEGSELPPGAIQHDDLLGSG